MTNKTVPGVFKTSTTSVSTLAILVAGLLMPISTAQAQDAPATRSSFDEIIVTARKVEESVETTPIAITAMTGDTLAERGAANIEQAARFVPNVNISSNGGAGGSSTTSNIFIRGIGQFDFLITTDPGVGVYIDGVYYARATGSIMDLLDLERVEVLRGPQGTLFGKNTIGGAISMISREPSGEGGGSVQLLAGNNNYYEGRLSLDVPISENLNSRFSALYKTQDGFTDRILVGDRQGDQETIAARGMFAWTPTDQFNLDVAIDYSNHNGTSAELAILQYDPTAPLAGLWQAFVGTPNGVSAPTIVNTDPRESLSTGPNVDDNEVFGTGITAEYHFDDVTLKSISAVRTLSADFGRDNDGTPVTYLETHNKVEQIQYSQELQLSGGGFDDRLDWVVGGYYFKEIAKDTNQTKLASGLFNGLESLPGALIPLVGGSVCPGPFPPNVCAGGLGNPFNVGLDLDFDIYNKIHSESYAAFGSMTFALNEEWNVSAGLRYTTEDKEYFLSHNRVNAGVPIIPATTVENSFDAFSPKFSIDYQPTDTMFLYGSIARGYKSGGFNGRPTSQGEVEAYDPEFVWSYELGMKTSFADRRILLSAAAFYYDYQDLQLNSVRADATGSLLLVVENAGTAIVKGVEAELRAKLSDNFTIDASAGLLDAEYDKLNPGATVTKDLRLPRTPKFTASIGAEYVFDASPGFDVIIRGDYAYQSRQALETNNTPILVQDGYGLLNGRIALSPKSANWEVAIFGKNITDELHLIGGLSTLDSFGNVEATYGLPVQYGVSTKLKF